MTREDKAVPATGAGPVSAPDRSRKAECPILLHAHLFKNAGSSLDWSLARSFDEAFLDHRDDEAMRGNPGYLRSFLVEQRSLAALSSHWLPLPVTPVPGREVFVVALLRDPMLRLRSVYDFERRQDVDHPGTRKARSESLAAYVAWRLQPETGPVIRNYQTRMLSGTFPGDDDRAQFDAARACLDRLTFVGLVERYDESMVLLEALLRPVFPRLDLAYVAQNVTARHDEPEDHKAQRASIEGALGSVAEEAIRANAHDQCLYDGVVERFDATWSALPQARDRLVDFRRRCEALAA